MTDVVTGDIMMFDPNLQVPYAQTWTAGWQRKLTGDMAVEARYVGTRSLQSWQTYNYNETNIVENGFLNEFRLAQQNLQANVAAGCGGTGNACSFAYRGAARTRRRCRPSSPTSTAGRMPANTAAYTGGELDQLDVPGIPRRATTRTPSAWSPTPTTRV